MVSNTYIWMENGKGVTCNGFWELEEQGREKVSRVRVSGGSKEKAKGVTCNGFRVLGGSNGKGVTCNSFWGFGGKEKKMSHVTASGGWREKGKVSHVTVSGVRRKQWKRCHM